MVGRNDPCPCGSGKKYKKCCELKKENLVETLSNEELERIIVGVYEQPPSPADITEFNQYRNQWVNRLGELWDSSEIEEAVSEYFLFIARSDLWKRHLVKMLNSPIRSMVRSVLELWQNPFVLLGKVKEEQDGFFVVEEILGNRTHFMEKNPGMQVDEHTVVFGVVLPDNRKRENGVYILTALMFIKDGNEAFANKMAELAASSGCESSFEFYKKHMIDIYEELLSGELSTVDELIHDELMPLQLEAVNRLEEVLAQEDVHPEMRQVLKNIIVTYFMAKQPKFRKPDILSAAVFQVACDLGIVEDLDYTQSRVAKLFGVSVGAMVKHADAIYDYVVEMMGEVDRGGPVMTRDVGTDPRMTERVNWEMYCKIEGNEFETIEQVQAYMNHTMNEPFIPKGEKQQAQALAYDAYDAESDIKRYRLAEKAAALDPENVDVLLLKAEMVPVAEEKEHYYKAAIKYGEAHFDEEPDIPWNLVTNRPYMRAIYSYGIWLFEGQRFTEAAQLFDKLLAMNPGDNQGARYLAISCHVHADNYDRALEILDVYEVDSEEDATYLFLDWYAWVAKGEAVDTSELFGDAHAMNQHVAAMLNGPAIPYPKRLQLVPGSKEEAQYIYKLLN